MRALVFSLQLLWGHWVCLHSSHSVKYIICVYLSWAFLYIVPWFKFSYASSCQCYGIGWILSGIIRVVPFPYSSILCRKCLVSQWTNHLSHNFIIFINIHWQQFSLTSMTEPVSENLFIWNAVFWRPYCEWMPIILTKPNYWF